MNYYNFHIGDYRGATAHLTNDEDLCYRRILDVYYDKDGNLPEIQTLARRIRFSEEVVGAVLAEFFHLTESGWLHNRAQKEIDSYIDRVELAARAGRASAASRTRPTATPVEFPLNRKSTPVEIPLNGKAVSVEPTNNQEPITNIPPTPQRGKVEEVFGESVDVDQQPHQAKLSEEAAEFQRFWDAYPPHRRNKMVTTQREWLAMAHNRPAIEFIMSALGNHKQSEDWSRDGGKFVPSALNWISEQAWHEKKAPAKKSTSLSVSKPKVIPKVDEEEAEAWLAETYPAKAGTPFSHWPPNIQSEFIDISKQLTTQAA